MNRHVKIALDFEGTEGTGTETVWAVAVEEGYRLDNIPFYARGVAYGDIVMAEPESHGLLRYTELVAPSGHSTIRLWCSEASGVQAIRDELRAMGCASELDVPRLVAVDVPPGIPYEKVRRYLDEKERAGVFEYEEGCLGQPVQDRC